MRGHGVRPVAGPGHHPTAYVEIDDLRRQKLQRHLQLSGIDVLALARSSAMVQRRHDRRRQKAGSDGIGVGHPGSVWGQVWPAGHLIEAGDGAGVVAVASESGGRAALAHEAGAGHDDGGVQGASRLVADAQIVHRAGGEALDVDVRPGDEATGDPGP